MASEHEITFRNCTFRFKCPEDWDGLTKTDEPRIRYCSQCDRGVHLCRTEKELATAISASRCVAIPRALMSEEDDSVETLHVMGDIAPNYGDLDLDRD